MVTAEEKPLKGDHASPKKKTFKEKIEYIKQTATVEPVLAFYVIPGLLARLATQNLTLDKACRVNLQYGDSVCDALIARKGNDYLKEELAVQELIAAMESWKNVILTAIPSCLILFLGAWSDRTKKRKMCIIMPIVGDLLMCLSNILNAYFFYELPVQVTMFFEAFFPAITGGWITIYMGAFSYISDASSEESRTFRVGVANLCLSAGGPIGSVLSGVLLEQIGYYGVFTLSALMYFISICYGLINIKDPEIIIAEKSDQENPLSICESMKSFFDFKHVKDTLTVGFKKGPDHRRAKSILVLASVTFIYGSASGEYSVKYLYSRYRFNWDAFKYSLFNTFYICTHCLGALISISVFSRRLKWDDSILGLISTGSKIIGALGSGLARTTTQMYIVVAIEMFNATAYTALRAISSKLVTSEESGKMASLFNLMEVLTSMVFGPIYSWMYMMTLHIDAGIFYFVSAVLSIPPLMIFGWFYVQHKKNQQTHSNESTQEEKEKLKAPHKPDLQENKNEYLFNSLEIVDEKMLH